MLIGITMRQARIQHASGACEIRDSLDCGWYRFINLALPNAVLLPLPNVGLSAINKMLASLPFTGFIFSGGEDWGDYPERDATERAIYNFALERKLPIIGVCRGAQILNFLTGGKSGQRGGHVNSKHKLNLALSDGYLAEINVNSFHNNVIFPHYLAPCLIPWAWAPDETVEAFWQNNQLCGMMWHPEREESPQELNLKIFKNFLGGKDR